MAAKAWLAVTVVAFVGWLGYLGYLVAERPAGGTVVLSRPQFLVSDLDVVATVKQNSDVVTVREVLYPPDPQAQALKGKEITITNLAACHPPGRGGEANPDRKADGDYLLALQDPGPGGKEYRVTITPPSPGFLTGTPRIYPATHEVLSQYRQIPKR
jgi:hypothetical protein